MRRTLEDCVPSLKDALSIFEKKGKVFARFSTWVTQHTAFFFLSGAAELQTIASVDLCLTNQRSFGHYFLYK